MSRGRPTARSPSAPGVLWNRAFVLVLCAQAASGIVGGAAPMALPATRELRDLQRRDPVVRRAVLPRVALVLDPGRPDRRPPRHPPTAADRVRHVHLRHHRQRWRRRSGAPVLPPPAGSRRRRHGPSCRRWSSAFHGHDRTRAFGVFLMVAAARPWWASWCPVPSSPPTCGASAGGGCTCRRSRSPWSPWPSPSADSRRRPRARRAVSTSGVPIALSAASFLLMFPLIQGRSAGPAHLDRRDDRRRGTGLRGRSWPTSADLIGRGSGDPPRRHPAPFRSASFPCSGAAT